MHKSNLFPEITLKWAQTLDGQLADDADQSQWMSGQEERRYTHWLRSKNDGILVGAQTFLKDLCQLTVRDIPYAGTQPARIIMDPKSRVAKAIAKDSKVFDDLVSGPRRTYLLTDTFDDVESVDCFPFHENLIMITRRYDQLGSWLIGILSQLSFAFEVAEHRRLKNLMVEGGAGTLAAFLKADLADRLEVAISPMILGGSRHRVFTKNLLKNVSRFEVESQEQFGADVLLRYKIPKLNFNERSSR